MDRTLPFPAFAVLALVALSVAGCLDDFGTVEAPDWETGYAFSYAGSGSYRVDAVQTVNGEVVHEVHEQEDGTPFDYFLEVLDDDFDAAGEPVYLSALTVPGLEEAMESAGLDGLSVLPVGVRHRDLAMLHPDLSYQQNCLNGVCQTDIDYTFPPSDGRVFLDFPLQKGDVWSHTEEGDGLNTTVRFEAEGAESVETPIGTFSAVRIAVTVTLDGLDDLLEAARQEAAAEGIEVEELSFDQDARATLWYSPDHGAVVKTATRFEETAHIVFRQDGDRHESSVDTSAESMERLVGARLIAGPERSEGNIRQVFLGGERLVDPTGEAVPVGGAYGIDLTADRATVNAAESPTVTFTVTPTEPLPDDHSLQIDLRGPDGVLVASDASDSLQHVVTDPGVFIAQAYALDAAGDRQATDAALLVADYEARVPAACLPAASGTAAALTCDPVSLPVRNGIRSLTVSFVPSGTAALPELVVTDPMGNDATGATTVHIDDFSGYTVDSDDWSAQWRPAATVLEAGEYVIHLDHGGTTSADDEGDMDALLPRGAGLAFRGMEALLERPNGVSTGWGGTALHIVTKDLN